MVATGLLLYLWSAFVLVCTEPTVHNLVVHERRESVPRGFVRHASASSATILDLRIALVSKDMSGLEKALYDVSTPENGLYGQHLSKAEVEEFVRPLSHTTAAVNEWLTSHGLKPSPISPAGDWFGFSIDVKTANKLLDADFSIFTHQATGKRVIRTLSYSIPAPLKGLVELVHPTISFSVGLPLARPRIPLNKNAPHAALASCASEVTPECLRALYGIPDTPATQRHNRLGVFAIEGEYAQHADLTTFLKKFRKDIKSPTTFALQTLDGGSNPQGLNSGGMEASLDIQYTMGVATGVPTTFISVGLDTTDHILGFLDVINTLLSEATPPQVLTTSYGFTEDDDISESLATNLCNAYMQLGARGVSLIFASGDGGVSGIQPQECSTFHPTFPSTCPYVTSVGATAGIAPEIAGPFSSGGFSNLFARPKYQAAAVSRYLSKIGHTHSGLFNSSGRAFPDVSAQGTNLVSVSNGQIALNNGTSGASPIFASVISLLNDELIASGKRPLGFLNPFLYSIGAAALNDVTTGDNPGCNTHGFSATRGWDPVTGLGTPNYRALRTAAGLR